MANFIKFVKNSIKHWYLITFSGIIFIALGIWVWMTPLESFQALSVLFSISFLVSGLSEVYFSVSNRKELEGWGWTFTFGLVNIIIGVLLLMNPEVSLATLPFYVGFMVMFRSIYAISASMELRYYGILDWGNLLAVGIIGLILSFFLVASPVFSGISLVIVTGSAFVVLGIYSIYYSVKLKKINKKAQSIKKEVKEEYEKLRDEIYADLSSIE